MGRRRHKEGPKVKEDISPNIIPMVDIMFLLLLFFMLSADMAARDIEIVELPRAWTADDDSKVEDPNAPVDKRAMINVWHNLSREISCAQYEAKQICRNKAHWLYSLRGTQFPDNDVDIKKLVEKLKGIREEYDANKGMTSPASPTQPSEMTVMIRADHNAPYSYVQTVMGICGKLFIYKVEVGAAIAKAEGEKK